MSVHLHVSENNRTRSQNISASCRERWIVTALITRLTKTFVHIDAAVTWLCRMPTLDENVLLLFRESIESSDDTCQYVFEILPHGHGPQVPVLG